MFKCFLQALGYEKLTLHYFNKAIDLVLILHQPFQDTSQTAELALFFFNKRFKKFA